MSLLDAGIADTVVVAQALSHHAGLDIKLLVIKARKKIIPGRLRLPRQLAGEAIPLSARLMALADVYDALISRRIYKPALSHEQAVAIIEAGRGRISSTRTSSMPSWPYRRSFQAIARRFSDIEAEPPHQG